MEASSLKALVADDCADSRDEVATALRRTGIENITLTCDSGSAYNFIRAQEPDFAYIGFSVPLDGLRILNAVRRILTGPIVRLPMFMMVSATDAGAIARLRIAGANDILVKPLTFEKVISPLRNLESQRSEFVQSDNYVGPCRRRSRDALYAGPFRRKTDDPRLMLELK